MESAATSKTIRIKRNTNMPLAVDSVPAETATFWRFAKLPARHNAAAMGMKRLASKGTPSTLLRKGVLQFMPAKAEPLLAPADVAA